jgi:hypothetical protein
MALSRFFAAASSALAPEAIANPNIKAKATANPLAADIVGRFGTISVILAILHEDQASTYVLAYRSYSTLLLNADAATISLDLRQIRRRRFA